MTAWLDSSLRGWLFAAARTRRARRAMLTTSSTVLLAFPAFSNAQQVPRPVEQGFEVPEFAVTERPTPASSAPRFVLPPLRLPTPGSSLAAGGSLGADGSLGVAAKPLHYVSEYRFIGNTIFSDTELRELTRDYQGRRVSYEELQSLSRLVTLFYVRQGYVTSGATISRIQADGTAELRVTEGVLDRVTVEGARYFRPKVLQQRVMPRENRIVNIREIERKVQDLLDDARIDRLDAELVPGSRRGEAELRLRVEETRPFEIALELSNEQSPGVGREQTELRLRHLNLSGSGDVLEGSYAKSQGVDDLQIQYQRPIAPFAMLPGATFGLRFASTRSENREDPFRPLDIRSRAATYALDLSLPVYSGDRVDASVSLAAEVRNSRSFLLGDGFAFSEGVEPDGSTRVRVLRLSQEATFRGANRVLALRSTFSLGSGALGATSERVEPDGRFVSWLGRLRYAQRLAWLDATAIVRLDVQLSNDPLFSLEQFSVGGVSSVRGYRRSLLLRDTGVTGSVEVRIPVWRRVSGDPLLEVAPFYDFGSARNVRRPTPGLQSLSSAGVGFRTRIGFGMLAELYVAESFRDVPSSSDDTALSDRGIHFRILQEF